MERKTTLQRQLTSMFAWELSSASFMLNTLSLIAHAKRHKTMVKIPVHLLTLG